MSLLKVKLSSWQRVELSSPLGAQSRRKSSSKFLKITWHKNFSSLTRFCLRSVARPVKASFIGFIWRTTAAIACLPTNGCATHSTDSFTKHRRLDHAKTAASPPLTCPSSGATTQVSRPGLRTTRCSKLTSITSTTSTASTTTR